MSTAWEPVDVFEEVLSRSKVRRSFDPIRARTVRRLARLSQADIAKALGVRRSSVCRWESGERAPRGAIAENYAAILDALAREVAK
jgi:transcriptional regulator with XRE-family HTH domain